MTEFLEFIEDKETFLPELISAINQAIQESDSQSIRDCLDDWEASAELNSIPGLSQRVKDRFQSLEERGII